LPKSLNTDLTNIIHGDKKMINIKCLNKSISSFFIETRPKNPVYINGELVYDLYLEKRNNEGFLYINGVRAKSLINGVNYQLIEAELFEYFDEICRLFDDNTEIDVDKETYLPLSIKVNGKSILKIEFEKNSVKMVTGLSINEIRNIRTKFEKTFNNIFSLLEKVNLHG
jgi:hypothetical protein